MSLIQTRMGMPLERFLEQSERTPFELIQGERKDRLPNIFIHNEIIRLLDAFIVSRQLGEVYSEMTFVQPDADDTNWIVGSRIPDLMVYVGNRIADYKARTPNYRERPLALVPDFVIEIVSPSDKVIDLDEKIDAYLSDGVRLIWVINPQRRKATVYSPDTEQPLHLSGDALLDGDDVLPGFRVSLAEVVEVI